MSKIARITGILCILTAVIVCEFADGFHRYDSWMLFVILGVLFFNASILLAATRPEVAHITLIMNFV